MNELQCKSCGERYYYFKDYVFCPLCGERFAHSSPNQQRATNTAQSPTPTTPPANSSSKSKSTALLLCLLGFIGFCGLHRFYVGKTKSGLVNLFTFGICWIWTIIDLLLIVSNKFTDKDGAILQ